MQSLGRLLARLTALAAVAALGACSHSNNNSNNTGNVRLINASTSATITVNLNGTATFTSVAPSTATGYATETSGSYTVTATSATGAVSAVSPTLSVAAGYFSVIAYDSGGQLYLSTINENQTAPVAGDSTVAFVNTSPDSGYVDLYVVLNGTSISSATPNFSRIPPGGLSSYVYSLTLISGTSYDIYVTGAANYRDVRLAVKGVTVASAGVETFVFTGTPGGGLLNAVEIQQQSTVTFTNNATSRVRVVSALPVADASQVVFTSGTTSQPTPTSTLLPSDYFAITSGGTSYSLTVAGVAVPSASLPAVTFAAGQDYTVLVYGTTASPQVKLLTDNNRAPGATQASLRVVNVGSSASGGVALLNNSTVLTSGVTLGTATPYFNAGSGTASLLLLAPGSAAVPITIGEGAPASFLGNTSYTIFVLDGSLNAEMLQYR